MFPLILVATLWLTAAQSAPAPRSIEGVTEYRLDPLRVPPGHLLPERDEGCSGSTFDDMAEHLPGPHVEPCEQAAGTVSLILELPPDAPITLSR